MDDKDKLERISKLVDRTTEIPSLPSLVSKVLEVAESPASSAQDLSEIISKDPVLTAQILKAANSAFYGFPNKIGTVTLSIIILGFNVIKTIALSGSVLKIFKSALKGGSVIDAVVFWEHSLKCAVACKLVATNYKYYVAGEAFTAGILHDIGRIALAHHLPNEYGKVVAYQTEQGCTMLVAEEAVLGFTHADFGGVLLERWSLPLLITDAVRYHHDPMVCQGAIELAAITHLANYLCHLDNYRKGKEAVSPVLNEKIWDTLKRTESEEEAIENLLLSFGEEVEKAKVFFDILHNDSDLKR
jgi:HD-like signal output (HDOD) protein